MSPTCEWKSSSDYEQPGVPYGGQVVLRDHRQQDATARLQEKHAEFSACLWKELIESVSK